MLIAHDSYKLKHLLASRSTAVLSLAFVFTLLLDFHTYVAVTVGHFSCSLDEILQTVRAKDADVRENKSSITCL